MIYAIIFFLNHGMHHGSMGDQSYEIMVENKGLRLQ